MTETPWTKGPWSVTHNSWDRSTVYDADGCELCEVPISWEADEETQDHFEAIKETNARLISCAPELVEALEDMLAGWRYIRQTHGDLYGVGWDRCEDTARAVLTKARGGAAKGAE